VHHQHLVGRGLSRPLLVAGEVRARVVHPGDGNGGLRCFPLAGIEVSRLEGLAIAAFIAVQSARKMAVPARVSGPSLGKFPGFPEGALDTLVLRTERVARPLPPNGP